MDADLNLNDYHDLRLGQKYDDYPNLDVPEVSSYEDYEHLKAKQRASILWLLSKAYNNEIPLELREPYYKNHDDQDRLKPQIVQGLASAELYCLALANIYADPNYHVLNHHGIIQLLTRKGIYVAELNDFSLTETTLIKITPIRMSSHLIIIEAIMSLFIKEVLIPEKVVEVVTRFSNPGCNEFPNHPEEAALFWINNCSLYMRQRIKEELNKTDNFSKVLPSIPMIEDLQDISDGCSLAALLSLYCPDHLSWTEVCLNELMSMADSIYNIQLVQFFCQQKLPYNICFLSLEDLLYLHPTIRPNVLAFIADLLYLFEIRPAPCVKRPNTKDELGFDSEDDGLNGSKLRETCPLTPSEMKAKSLQHTSWGDMDSSLNKRQSRALYNNQSTGYLLDEDEEMINHFSTLDLPNNYETSLSSMSLPNHGSRSLNHINVFNADKSANQIPESYFDQVEKSYQSFQGSEIENGVSLTSFSKSFKNDSSSLLEDYFTQIGDVSPPNNNRKSSNSTTSFANLSKSKEYINYDNRSEINSLSENRQSGINIGFKQKNDKNEKEKYRTWSRDKLGDTVCQQTLVNSNLSSQKTLAQLNDSSLIKKCLKHDDQEIIKENKMTEVNNKNDSEDQLKSQMHNVRLKLEEKRRMIEQEKKAAKDMLQLQRQDACNEAFLRVLKSRKQPEVDGHNNESLDDRESSESSSVKEEPMMKNEKGFFISFGDEKLPKVKPPTLRSKSFVKSKPLAQTKFKVQDNNNNSEDRRKNVYSGQNGDDHSLFRLNNEMKISQSSSLEKFEKDLKPETYDKADKENKNSKTVSHPVGPGVGFVIGNDLDNTDPVSELEMAKKKEIIIMQSLRRRADQEANKIAKERELAKKREEERQRKEILEKKKEEEKVRRQTILDQYRFKKAQEEAEKNGSNPNFSNFFSKDSNRAMSSLYLNRPARLRTNSTGFSKPRPKSLHISVSTIPSYTSLNPKSSRTSDDIETNYSTYSSSTALHPSSSSRSTSRPQSSLSGNSNSSRRLILPSRLPPLPPFLSLGKYKSNFSDGASDTGSTFSEYTGPKLFVKPTQKSNRGIILNAINVVLAGAVNSSVKKKVLEEINNIESNHFLILFRGAGMQFRAIYSYYPEKEEVIKIYGNGPKVVSDDMMDKFYKYNCGGKNFNEVQTKHLTVTIDAFTIHNTLWSGKRTVPYKKDLF